MINCLTFRLVRPINICPILPAKAVPEMTYNVSGGTSNPIHSRTASVMPSGDELFSQFIMNGGQ